MEVTYLQRPNFTPSFILYTSTSVFHLLLSLWRSPKRQKEVYFPSPSLTPHFLSCWERSSLEPQLEVPASR